MAQNARSQQIDQKRAQADELVMYSEKGQSTSEQAPARSVAQEVAATVAREGDVDDELRYLAGLLVA